MNQNQLTALMAHVLELWPKCDWTDKAQDAFLAGVKALDVADEQWRACVDECWRESRYGKPDQATLTARLRELNRANRTAPGATADVNPQRVWRETDADRRAYERGLAEARAWAANATGEEITAARETLAKQSRGALKCPPITKAQLQANEGRCVSLFAAHRLGCREAVAR